MCVLVASLWYFLIPVKSIPLCSAFIFNVSVVIFVLLFFSVYAILLFSCQILALFSFWVTSLYFLFSFSICFCLLTSSFEFSYRPTSLLILFLKKPQHIRTDTHRPFPYFHYIAWIAGKNENTLLGPTLHSSFRLDFVLEYNFMKKCATE